VNLDLVAVERHVHDRLTSPDEDPRQGT
jgi:hypothetical protein